MRQTDARPLLRRPMAAGLAFAATPFLFAAVSVAAPFPELGFMSVEQGRRFRDIPEGSLHPQIEGRFAG